MTTAESRPPVSPGESAPDFSLPAVTREEMVSLADYRGRSSVFLALFIGLWCPFCRRSIAQMGAIEDKLQAVGVETLGIVATAPQNARLYFKFRPTRLRLAADPELTTHRAYGLPKPAPTPEFMNALQTVEINPEGALPEPLPIAQAAAAIAKLDGYEEN
ncbi:MAG TPA: redoxin domain-containing protein, partial [Gemmatimonadales bacterium]|nr:redoxin domain-containing protein [Gemmatimonadales bacterium]